MVCSINKILIAALISAAATATAAADNSYLDRSSWSWSASSTDTQDGGGLAALHDDDYSTFWHTNYHSEESHNCPHWVMIDRQNDSNEFIGLSYVPRQGAYNNIVTKFRVYISSKPFGTISSVDESVLGAPTYSGTFDGQEDYSERTFSFGKKHTERYVLFVIDSSNSGRSTAMAEFYLLSKAGAGSSSKSYNSVLIHNYDGSDHRIAIDGEALNVTLNGKSVHLSNTGITIEYEIPEVKYFSFEKYDFPEDTYYIGNKKDLSEIEIPLPDPVPFDLTVTPADGSTMPEGFTSISIAHSAGLSTKVAGSGSVLLSRGVTPVYRWNATQLAEAYDEATCCYTFSGLNCSVEGTYVLSVPSNLIVETETPTNYNNLLTARFKVQKVDGLDSASTPTLTFRNEGRRILISGISSGSEATLFSIGGTAVASATVTPFGTAAIDASALQAGVYVLSVDGKTFKITI